MSRKKEEIKVIDVNTKSKKTRKTEEYRGEDYEILDFDEIEYDVKRDKPKKKKKFVTIGKMKITRLNFSLLISTGLMILLVLILSLIMLSRSVSAGSTETPTNSPTLPGGSSGGGSSEETTVEDVEETTIYIDPLEFDPDDDENAANSPSRLRARLSLINTWDTEDGTKVSQYRIRLTNITSSDIENWGLAIHFAKDIELLDSWNGVFELDEQNIKITPVTRNYTLNITDEYEIGFLIETNGYAYPTSYTVVLDDFTQTIKVSFSNTTQTTKPTETTTTHTETDTTLIEVTTTEEATEVETTEETSSETETTTESSEVETTTPSSESGTVEPIA